MYCRGPSSPASAPGSAERLKDKTGADLGGEEDNQQMGGVFAASFSGDPAWDWNHLDHSSGFASSVNYCLTTSN
ncbi:MAG TPA: hypothetical protein VFY83_04875 [Anaerolineales bacterium]|jgi:hypothetical protein|nr:hypothetical protein [Anaerolineales bacterium]